MVGHHQMPAAGNYGPGAVKSSPQSRAAPASGLHHDAMQGSGGMFDLAS